MNCPKCGSDNQDTVKQCENCGFGFYPEEKIELPDYVMTTSKFSDISKPVAVEDKLLLGTERYICSKETVLGIFLFVIAAIVFLFSIVGALSIFHGGSEIAEIQSVGGKTLEEAYYYRLHSVYNGYGFLVLTVGIFCTSVLSAAGCFCIWNSSLKSENKGASE